MSLLTGHCQINPLSANPTKWSNTQTIRRQKPTNGLSVFDHFVELALKGLSKKGKRTLLEKEVEKPKSTFRVTPLGFVLVQLLKRNALKTKFSNTSILYQYIRKLT